ncbi:MAG: PHP domain-containing protein [Balneolaceae bacterium]|nr:MAG: PHP domain-containing protein [Balneolaceae bacterium]
MGKADLHTHTNASDGDLSPEELLKKAQSKKLKTLAITDHDTIKGYLAAKGLAADFGIELISGVEITAIWNSKEVHLLAYNFDDDDPEFRNLLLNQRTARKLRMQAIVSMLNSQGLKIEYDEVLAEANMGNVGRPHAASVLIKKGYVSGVAEAFIRYLSSERLRGIQTQYAAIKEVLRVVKEAGGVISLAHPGRLYSDTEITSLINLGLDGLECIHPSHNFTAQRKYTALAKSENLLITGGSDYHGTGKSEYDPYFGIVTLGEQHIEALKRTSENRQRIVNI